MEERRVNIEDLHAHWRALLNPFAVNEQLVDEAFTDIVAHYEQDDRFYHNLEHIQNVLNATEAMQSEANDLTAIQLAAWFHDVIYAPQATDNEERSADYAEEVMQRLQIPAPIINKVKRFILATKTHLAAPEEGDCRILLDADLATLASAQEQYDRYSRAIRREFGFISEADYSSARIGLLGRFLKRKRIFLTDQMASKEERARHNIEREIASLAP